MPARAVALLFTLATIAHAQAPLCDRIRALTQDPTVAAAHWGVQVATLDGTPLCGVNEAQLFRPASNAKIFTTAAALALLGPNATVETEVLSHGVFTGKEHLDGSLYLFGNGDANLSGRRVPYAPGTDEALPPLHSLDDLAAQVARTGLRSVTGDVIAIGDHFGNEPYPNGWSQDDILWGYGAPVSALDINDNEIKLTITPATELSSRATIEMTPALRYYTLSNDVMTTDTGSATSIAIERTPGSRLLHLYGHIALKASPETDHVAIEDPPAYAAMALKQALERQGILIDGHAIAEHVTSQDPRGFREVSRQPLDLPAMMSLGRGVASGLSPCPDPCDPAKISTNTLLGSLTSSTLLEDVILTNKSSINLHAEILLRRLGDRISLPGTFAEGARVVRQFLIDRGISADDVTLYDGSGLSTYDLVTPRSIIKLLAYGAAQPWGPAWKSSFPVGGVDGTLSARFTGPLKGRVFAKTGTLGESRALSGYLIAASGKTLIFSILVDNHLPGSADRVAMDKIVAAIAAGN